MTDATALFEQQRDLLTGVAYRILGRVGEAEDVVQDAWLRWRRADPEEVRDPRAFLVRVTTRLAIDRLRRAKARREAYVGEWLPEPIATDADAAARAELAESISIAMLVVLETLSPLERAVYVLREAFGFSHAEVADALDRSEPAVRQLAARARRHVQARRTRYAEPDPATRRAVTERFLAASASGDLDALMAVLAPGVRLAADGGGRVRAPLRPVVGADKVARFLVAAAGRQPEQPGAVVRLLNGAPGILVTSAGRPSGAVALELDGHRIAAIYLVANPDKLAGLAGGPVARPG